MYECSRTQFKNKRKKNTNLVLGWHFGEHVHVYVNVNVYMTDLNI